jgi:hypothetical protein
VRDCSSGSRSKLATLRSRLAELGSVFVPRRLLVRLVSKVLNACGAPRLEPLCPSLGPENVRLSPLPGPGQPYLPTPLCVPSVRRRQQG